MTRINVVDPTMLSDKHLMAEYRELPRVFTAVLKLQNQGFKPSDVDIPSSYRLGAGHVKFFYDKVEYLYYRYAQLVDELKTRNFSLNDDLIDSITNTAWCDISAEWWNDYYPTIEALYLNMARLAKRSKMKCVEEELSSDK